MYNNKHQHDCNGYTQMWQDKWYSVIEHYESYVRVGIIDRELLVNQAYECVLLQ